MGHLAMVLLSILVAGSFSLGSLAVPHIDPGALTAIRFFIGVIVMGIVVLWTVEAPVQRMIDAGHDGWSQFLLLGILMGSFFVSMFVALKDTDPVSTGAIFTLMPIFTAVFAYFILGQRLKKILLMSLVVAGLGALWVIFRGDLNRVVGFHLGRGETIFLFGTIAHALYAPLVAKFNKNVSVFVFTFWTLVATLFWVTIYAFPQIIETPWAQLPTIVWVAIVYLSTFTTAGTFFLMQFALIRIPSAKATAYVYLTPGLIILLEGISGRGWVSPAIFVGAFVSIVGLVILARTSDV